VLFWPSRSKVNPSGTARPGGLGLAPLLGGKPLFAFGGNSKNFGRDFSDFAESFGGNSGAKSAGEVADL
jgi:hypothetical protein